MEVINDFHMGFKKRGQWWVLVGHIIWPLLHIIEKNTVYLKQKILKKLDLFNSRVLEFLYKSLEYQETTHN